MVIILSGEDTYRSRARFRLLLDAFKKKYDLGGFNIQRFDGANPSFDEVQSAFGTMSFLAKKRLIAFENFFSAKTSDKQKNILEYISKRDSDDQVILFSQEGRLPGASSRLTFVKQAKHEEFELLDGYQLAAWVDSEAQKRTMTLRAGARRILLERVGSNLWTLTSILDQLQAFAQDANGEVTEQMALEFTESVSDDNIFHLTDELAKKNISGALKLFQDQVRSGAHPLYVLTMLTRQFRIFLQVSQSGSDSLSAMELGIQPFVLQKSREHVGGFTATSLRTAYQMLEHIDKKLKTGEKDVETLFSRFIYQVAKA